MAYAEIFFNTYAYMIKETSEYAGVKKDEQAYCLYPPYFSVLPTSLLSLVIILFTLLFYSYFT
jgi:hypothetical protein